MGFLEVTFLLIFFLPSSKPLLDQTCVSIGYDLIEYPSHGLYVRDSNHKLVIVTDPSDKNQFCKEQFRIALVAAATESSWSIGGIKYGEYRISTATLSLYKPALGITVDDK